MAKTSTRPAAPRKADLLRQYRRATGIAASPRATNAWLSAEIAASRARYNANRLSAAVQLAALTTSAVGTYVRVRNEQAADPAKRSMGGDTIDRIKAAGAAAVAVAPGAALTAVQGTATVGAALTHVLPLGLTWHSPAHKALMATSRVAGRAVMPALAAWSAHTEALKDTSALRGAGRGLFRALDPTSIFMGKGIAERAYDKVFGAIPDLPKPGFWDRADDPRFQRQPNAYERFGNRALDALDSMLPKTQQKYRLERLPQTPFGAPRAPEPSRRVPPSGGTFDGHGAVPRGYIDRDARARALASLPAPKAPHAPLPAAPVYKDTWTDKNGKGYRRHDMSVRTG